MRIVSVSRGFSRQILFQFEKDVIDKIPLYRRVSVKGGKSVRRQNPYLTMLLSDRYALYKSMLTYDRANEKYTINADKYANAVRKWYVSHGYVDFNGQAYPWAAVHKYEDEAHRIHPDDEWFNYPDELKRKGKSHHPITEEGRRREREKRKEYRAKKKAIGYNKK